MGRGRHHRDRDLVQLETMILELLALLRNARLIAGVGDARIRQALDALAKPRV